MKAITILFDVALLGLVAYYFYGAVTRFMASDKPTTFERLVEAGHGSLTILTLRVSSVLAGLADFIPIVAEVFGAQGVAQAVQGVIPTGMVPYYIVGLNVLAELARRRPGGGGTVG